MNHVLYTKPFLGIVSANMFFWMSANFFLPVLPIYYHSLGMNDHQVGLAIGAYSLGAVVCRVLAGKAVDRWGGRYVITVGFFMSVAAIVSYYFSHTPLTATASRLLHGVGISGYAAAALTTVTLLHEEKYTTQAVAVYTLFTMFGIGIAASTAGWIFQAGGLVLVIAAGVGATALSVLLFPRKVELRIKSSAGVAIPLRKVVARPGIFIPTVGLAASNMCYGTIMTFLPLLMLSQGVTQLGGFYAAYAVAVIGTRFWVGWLCARYASERITFYVLVLLAATMAAAVEFSSTWALALSGVGIGVGYGLAFPVMATTITANTQPAYRGTALGFFTTAVDVGLAVGAIAMGIVADIWGYPTVFWIAGGYALAYALFYRIWLLRILEKDRGPQPTDGR